jgi:sodium-dependent dicarboxylate transporter 2/3/5
MNVICLLILQLAMNTWGYAYFKLGEYPAWAGNATAGDINIVLGTTSIMTLSNTTITI